MAEWLPIYDLFEFEKGTLQSSKCTPGPFTFITAAEDWKTHTEYTHDCEALIFAMAASGSLGRTHYFKGKFISSDLCFILAPKADRKLDLKFYYRVFNFLREDIVKKTATGTSKLAINQTNFGNYKLPYFDIEHQLAFSGKLDRISGIKNTLVTGFSEQTSFLSLFRQAVLREAVEGKLTAGWRKEHPEYISGDNHAACLLEKIKGEKENLIKEGKIKKEKFLPPIKEEEKPFELPEGWTWTRLGAIIKSMTNGIYKPEHFYNDSGVACLRMYNIDNGLINFKNLKRMLLTEDELRTYKLENGDLLLNRVNSIELLGKAAVLKDLKECMVYESKNIRVRFVINQIVSRYVAYVFLTEIIKNQILKCFKKVTGQASINQTQIAFFCIPLPPLSEQQAIVERVNKLMAMIDELEKQVSERKEQDEMLMQSVLREAFSNNYQSINHMSTIDIIRDNTVSALIPHTSKYLISIVENKGKNPPSIASGTLITIGGHYFVATAGHVLSGVDDSVLYVGHTGPPSYERLPFLKRKPLKKEAEPAIDVGYIEIPPASAKMLDKSFLPIKRLLPFINHAHCYVFLVGYPFDLIDFNPVSKQHLHLNAIGFLTETRDPETIDQHIDKNQLIVLEYEKTGKEISNHLQIDMPRAPGLSGGGLWIVLKKQNGLWSPDDARLIGIDRSWYEKTQVATCTQIQHWLNLIAEDYPDLRKTIVDFLEKHKTLANNLRYVPILDEKKDQ